MTEGGKSKKGTGAIALPMQVDSIPEALYISEVASDVIVTRWRTMWPTTACANKQMIQHTDISPPSKISLFDFDVR